MIVCIPGFFDILNINIIDKEIRYHFESIDFFPLQYGFVKFNFNLEGHNCDIVPPSHFHLEVFKFYPFHRIHHTHNNWFKHQKDEKNYDCIICDDDCYFWKLKRKYRVQKIIFINLPRWTENKAKKCCRLITYWFLKESIFNQLFNGLWPICRQNNMFPSK